MLNLKPLGKHSTVSCVQFLSRSISWASPLPAFLVASRSQGPPSETLRTTIPSLPCLPSKASRGETHCTLHIAGLVPHPWRPAAVTWGRQMRPPGTSPLITVSHWLNTVAVSYVQIPAPAIYWISPLLVFQGALGSGDHQHLSPWRLLMATSDHRVRPMDLPCSLGKLTCREICQAHPIPSPVSHPWRSVETT